MPYPKSAHPKTNSFRNAHTQGPSTRAKYALARDDRAVKNQLQPLVLPQLMQR
jgi:hypothetical protein